MVNHEDRRLVYLSVILAIILCVFVRLMLGELHDDFAPATVPTILPPPVLWTATPPFVVYVPSAEVKR